MGTYCIVCGTPLNVMYQSDGRGFGGEWIHVHTRLSPSCSLETITALLIGHSSIQNKKFKV